MPPREWDLRIEDMLECIEKIQSYTDGMSYEAFRSSGITMDAVLRNIEIIGEAGSHVPQAIAENAPEIPWDDIRGMRNVLAHEYFGANPEIVWRTVKEAIPPIIEPLKRLLASAGK